MSVPRCRLVGQRESRTLNRSSDVFAQRVVVVAELGAHDVAEQLAQLGEGAAQRAVLEEQVDQVLVGTVQRALRSWSIESNAAGLAKVGPDMNSTVMAHLVLLDCQAHALKQRGDASIGLARRCFAHPRRYSAGIPRRSTNKMGVPLSSGISSSLITRRPSARSAGPRRWQPQSARYAPGYRPAAPWCWRSVPFRLHDDVGANRRSAVFRGQVHGSGQEVVHRQGVEERAFGVPTRHRRRQTLAQRCRPSAVTILESPR